MTNIKTPKNAGKFNCDSCYFICNKESEWLRHLSTVKHYKRTNTNEKTPKTPSFIFVNVVININMHHHYKCMLVHYIYITKLYKYLNFIAKRVIILAAYMQRILSVISQNMTHFSSSTL